MSASEIGGYIGGVCVALLSTSTNATGLFLQKSVHKRREGTPKGQLPPLVREPRWLLGLLCLFAGSLLSLAVFALLGQSRASAMAALTIAINAVFATWFLGEKFTWIDAATTAAIGTGTVICVVFGSAAGGPDIHYNVTIIVNELQRTVVYEATPVFAGLYLMLAAYIWYSYSASKRGSASHWMLKAECIARGFCAGIFSGTTGFATKATVVCITNMWNSHDYSDLTRWQFYLFVLGLPASLACQLFYLNSGLKRFDSMEMIPPYQSSIVTVGVAFGWVYFNEADGVPMTSIIMFAVGCGISISGITLLFLKPRASKPADVKPANTEPLLADAVSSDASVGTLDAVAVAMDGKLAKGYAKLEDGDEHENGHAAAESTRLLAATHTNGEGYGSTNASRRPSQGGEPAVGEEDDSPLVHMKRLSNSTSAMLEVIDAAKPIIAQAVRSATDVVRRSRGESAHAMPTGIALGHVPSNVTLSNTGSVQAAATRGGHLPPRPPQ